MESYGSALRIGVGAETEKEFAGVVYVHVGVQACHASSQAEMPLNELKGKTNSP